MLRVQVSLDAVLLKLCDPFLEPLSGKAWGKVDPRCAPACPLQHLSRLFKGFAAVGQHWLLCGYSKAQWDVMVSAEYKLSR